MEKGGKGVEMRKQWRKIVHWETEVGLAHWCSFSRELKGCGMMCISRKLCTSPRTK